MSSQPEQGNLPLERRKYIKETLAVKHYQDHMKHWLHVRLNYIEELHISVRISKISSTIEQRILSIRMDLELYPKSMVGLRITNEIPLPF